MSGKSSVQVVRWSSQTSVACTYTGFSGEDPERSAPRDVIDDQGDRLAVTDRQHAGLAVWEEGHAAEQICPGELGEAQAAFLLGEDPSPPDQVAQQHIQTLCRNQAENACTISRC